MSVLTHQPWKRRMAREHFDDEDDYDSVRAAPRPAGPRFGPFVTIAVAILLLFGVASRVGKPVDAGNWLSLDLLASKSLNTERLRLQEQRNTTLVTLGAIPVSASDIPPPGQEPLRPSSVSLRADAPVLVPPRGDVDYDEYQESRRPPAIPLSLPLPSEPTENGIYHPAERYDGVSSAEGFDPAPEAAPQQGVPQTLGRVYTVAEGDNWVKIGRHFGVKWQDIQKANPQAADGLRVGMRLNVP